MRRVLLKTDDGTWIEPYSDYGLLTVTIVNTPPQAKTQYVEIPGRDGALDMTEWAGTVRFGTRSIQIKLRDLDGAKDDFVSAVYGIGMRVYTDDDTDYYYTGRCDTMTAEYRQHGVWDITMGITCEPYKRRVAETVVTTTTAAANTSITLRAERMPVVPTITVSGNCTMTINGTAHACAAGSPFKIPSLLVTHGGQEITIAETGITATFAWTDGRL